MVQFAIVGGLNFAESSSPKASAEGGEDGRDSKASIVKRKRDASNVADRLVEESIKKKRAHSLTYIELLMLLLADHF
jgi:hypothetical protein